MTKNFKIWIYPLFFVGVFLMILISCKKNEENTTPERWVSNKNIVFNPNLTYGTLTDIDGNVYKTIQIGTQTWMAENLKTTKYRNGDPIPNVIDIAVWGVLTSGAYCWYDNDSATYKANYGAFYNFYSVNDSRNIAPKGWHVASDTEWTTLTTYLGGTGIAGEKLKEVDLFHWAYWNLDSTNETGFTALPGGYLTIGLVPFRMGFWWSSTENTTEAAWIRSMSCEDTYVHRGGESQYSGFSVRCIKD